MKFINSKYLFIYFIFFIGFSKSLLPKVFKNSIPSTDGFNLILSPYVFETYNYEGNCDFNGDGIDDVIGGGYLDIGVFFSPFTAKSLYQLDGSNGFVIKVYTTKTANSILVCDDFNNDGFDDLVINIGNSSNSGDVVIIYGRNSFTPSSGTFYYNLPKDIDGVSSVLIKGVDNEALGYRRLSIDFNNDGISDLVIGNYPGVFSASQTSIKTYILYGINGGVFPVVSNNQIDLTAINGTNGCIINETEQYTSYSKGDFNNDGFDDLIFYGKQQNNFLIVNTGTNMNGSLYYEPKYDGIKGINITLSENFDFALFLSIKVGDFNGDGLNDLIIYHFRVKVYILFGFSKSYPGGSTFNLGTIKSTDGIVLLLDTSSSTNLNNVLCSTIEVSDINGDGVDDISCTSALYTTGWSYRFWALFGTALPLYYSNFTNPFTFNQNSAIFTEQCRNSLIAGNVVYTGKGDFNGDGVDDLLGLPYSQSGEFIEYIIYGQRYFSNYSINNQQIDINDTETISYKLFNNETFAIGNYTGECSTSFIRIQIISSLSTKIDEYQLIFDNPNSTIYTSELSNNNKHLLIYTLDLSETIINANITNNIHLKSTQQLNDTISFSIKYPGMKNLIYELQITVPPKPKKQITTTSTVTSNKKKTNIAVIVGPIIGGVALLALIGLGIAFYLKSKRGRPFKLQKTMTRLFLAGKVQHIEKY